MRTLSLIELEDFKVHWVTSCLCDHVGSRWECLWSTRCGLGRKVATRLGEIILFSHPRGSFTSQPLTDACKGQRRLGEMGPTSYLIWSYIYGWRAFQYQPFFDKILLEWSLIWLYLPLSTALWLSSQALKKGEMLGLLNKSYNLRLGKPYGASPLV